MPGRATRPLSLIAALSGLILTAAFACFAGPDDMALAASGIAFKELRWVTVNDTVMGGRSTASVARGEEGKVTWSGNLSLANNGGFVSIRSEDGWSTTTGAEGIVVELEGAGRDIQVSAQRRDRVIRAGGYRAVVHTRREGKTRLFIPFSAFTPRRFGRAIDGPALTDNQPHVGRWGLLIADKRPGAFAVTLHGLALSSRPREATLSPGIGASLKQAIERGVPLFNSGQHGACRDTYRKILSTLVDQGQLGQKSWSRQIAVHALKRQQIEDDTTAAWRLRRAMDSILRVVASVGDAAPR